MDSIDVELISPSTYVDYLNLRDEAYGYNEGNDELVVKRFRTFRIHYGSKECRKFFIDDFCERCEKVYGGLVNQYSKMTEEYIKKKYSSYFDITRDFATHSEVESHTWDDDEDDEYYSESTTIYVMVVHTYRILLKEGKNRNEFKLKHPELLKHGIFCGDYEKNKSNIKMWFYNILREAKNAINDKEVVNALRKKAGLE